MIFNRINKLRREEERMLKKIQETRRRAYEMLRLKKEREDIFENKLKMDLDHEQMIDKKRQRIFQDKEMRQRKINNLRSEILNSRKSLVKDIRTRSQLNDQSFNEYKHKVKMAK
jgi:hypothetical protein